ncbi:MAG: 50S ribosomal protein L3 [candidate division Zixibacteria bacterium]|nr:50S ribosomal protein L3 [candidate division Zixibacteria bacterium]
MINGIIGRKVGMTRVFNQSGNSVPVTVVEAGPCDIVQLKTRKDNGYDAIQLSFGERRKVLFNKPLSGHFGKGKKEPKRFLREIRLDSSDGLNPEQSVKVDIFKPGELVAVTGISKGLGFQGVVRRHHFSGGPKSHGQSDRHRAPGSVGGSSFPSRVFRGQRMAGRMGGDRVTVKNLMIVDVDLDKNVLLIEGAVPGKNNSLVSINKVKR